MNTGLESWKIIIGVLILILFMVGMMVITSGCSMPWSQEKTEPVLTEPPSPVKQLYDAARKSNWLVTISILGMAGGVFALMNGSAKLGTACIASASVSLFMALAVARYAAWMAVFGLVGTALAASISILARRKALVEIITGVQKFKDGYPDNADSKQNLQSKLGRQSSTTKKIVSGIKSGLKLNGQI